MRPLQRPTGSWKGVVIVVLALCSQVLSQPSISPLQNEAVSSNRWLAYGGGHACMIQESTGGGNVFCWPPSTPETTPPAGRAYHDLFVSQPGVSPAYSCGLRAPVANTFIQTIYIDCWGDASALITGAAYVVNGMTAGLALASTSVVGTVGTPSTITITNTMLPLFIATSISGGYDDHMCLQYQHGGSSVSGVMCFGLTSGLWLSDTPQAPTQSNGPYWTSLSVGYRSACATRFTQSLSSELVCWGALGATPSAEVRAVSCGRDDCCTIAGNLGDVNSVGLGGALNCFGPNVASWGTQPAGTFKTIHVGPSGACAVTVAGVTTCWGAPNARCYVPPPQGVTFIQVVAGHGRMYGIGYERAVYRWGYAGQDDIDLPVNYDATPYATVKAWPYMDVQITSGGGSNCQVSYNTLVASFQTYNMTCYFENPFKPLGEVAIRRFEWVRFTFVTSYSPGEYETLQLTNNRNGIMVAPRVPGARLTITCRNNTACVTATGGHSVAFYNLDFVPQSGNNVGVGALNLVSSLVTISGCTFSGFRSTNPVVRVINPYTADTQTVFTLTNSSFTGNQAPLQLFTQDSDVVIDTTSFNGNLAGGSLVAATTSSSTRTLSVTRSRFSDASGGAVTGLSVSGFGAVALANSQFGPVTSTASGACASVVLPNTATPATFSSTSNRFTTCSTAGSGGGVYLSHLGSVVATFNFDRFASNAATGVASAGGALFVSSQNAGAAAVAVVTVTNSSFVQNTATGRAGAVASAGSSSKTFNVFNSTFTSNTAGTNGGALALTLGALYVGNSGFTGNQAGANGGALSLESASPAISACAFTNNVAAKFGGAVFTSSAFQTSSRGSTFTGNQAGKSGGGLCMLESVSGSVTLNNNQFTTNSAAGGGGGLYWANLDGAAPVEAGNTFGSNTAAGWGADRASEPTQLLITGSTNWTTVPQPPGQSIRPAPTFNLRDAYNNLATTGITVMMSPTNAFSSLSATASQQGVVRFSDLRIGLLPNASSSLAVTVTAYLQGDGFSGALLTYTSGFINVRPCVDGEFFEPTQNEDGTTDYSCRLCTAGRFGGNEIDPMTGYPVCSDCGRGSYSNRLGVTQCQNCSSGTFTSVGGQTLCLTCLGLTYTDVSGTTQCKDCGDNSHSNGIGTACECSTDTYTEDVGAVTPRCVNCPVGAVCKYDGATKANLVVVPGFWRDTLPDGSSTASASIYSCPLQDGCRGGLVTASAATNLVSRCTPGFEGPLCAACSEGYYLVTNKCQPCSASSRITFPVVTVVLILFFFAMIYMGIKHRTLVRALFPWAAFKILIAYAQILSVMDIVYDIPLSSFFRNFLIGPKILLLNIFEALAYRCNAESSNYYTTLLFVTLAPIVVTSVLLVLYALVPQCVKKISYFRNYGHKALRNTLVNVVFVLFTFCYPGISVTTLRFFKCKQLSLADGTEPWFLQADYSIECYTAKYWRYSVLALVIMALIPVGMPIFLMIYLRRKSHRLHRYNTIRRVGQLYRDYRPELYYWEVEELFRKLVMAGIVMYIASGTVNQIGAGAFLGIMFHILHAVLQPFKQSAANALQHFALFAIWSTLFASLALKSGALVPDSTEAQAVQALVLVVNLFVLVLGFITAFQHVFHSYKTGKHLLVAQGKDKTVMCYNDQKVLGTVRCVDCHKLYCEQCDDVIHKAPAFVNHYRKPITVEEDDDDDAVQFDPKGRSNSRLGRSSRGRGETKGGPMASIVPGGELEMHDHVDDVFAGDKSPKSPASPRDGSSSRGSTNAGAPVPPPGVPPAPAPPSAPNAPLLPAGGSSDRPTGPAAIIAPMETDDVPAPKPGSLPRIPSSGALRKKSDPAVGQRKPAPAAPAPPAFLQQQGKDDTRDMPVVRDSVDLNIDIGDM